MSDQPTRVSSGAVTWVLGGLLLTVATAAYVGPRAAGYMLTLTMICLGTARAVLPAQAIQPFVIRSRWFDVVTMVGVGAVLAVLTMIAPF